MSAATAPAGARSRVRGPRRGGAHVALLVALALLATCDGRSAGDGGGNGTGDGSAGAGVGLDRARGAGPSRLATVSDAGSDGGDPGALPPGAQPDMLANLREARALPRHPSDGAGRAWIESGEPVPAGTPGRWTVVYEVGPHGIAAGGSVVFQAPPFWEWSEPQTVRDDVPGYTRVSTVPAGLPVEAQPPAPYLPRPRPLVVLVGEGGLREGQRIVFHYGAGPRGAYADQYAERESPFWIGVDGDGDGVHHKLVDSPTVQVLPGPPAQMAVTATSRARPGDPLRLTVALLDRTGSAGCAVEGEVRFALVPAPGSGSAPAPVALAPGDGGRAATAFTIAEPGVYRVRAEGPGRLVALSNPIEIDERVQPLLWGDLHGHSNLSDGTGTPEDYYDYARRVADLDVAVLTDHDHWGMLPLDEHPALWERIRAATEAAHEPGRFVTLPGYEWTSWIHGHRHVLYFDGEGGIHSSVDETCETPRQLWDALRGRDALTFAHHSAGGPIPTNWDIPPDPELEPVTEVMSVHGSSEAEDSPQLIYRPVRGNFVRDVLDRGYRLGFVGSGDGHDGHPGLTRLASPAGTGGLVALLTDDCTRAGVLSALRARRCYATSGQRMLLAVHLDGEPMGTTVAPSASARLVVAAEGTLPLASVEIVRSGAIVEHHPIADVSTGARLETVLADLRAGEYVYVRVTQRDDGTAWSSPIFVE